MVRHSGGEKDEERKVLTSVQPGGEQGLAIDLKTRQPTSVSPAHSTPLKSLCHKQLVTCVLFVVTGAAGRL